MEINSEVENLNKNCGQYIIDIFNNYDIKEKYMFEFNINGSNLFNSKEKEEINNEKNIFGKNVLLKNILHKKLKTKDATLILKYYNWIVKDWGGIRNGKINIIDINSFIDNIDKDKISAKQFDTISTYSKIVSFKEFSKYFILDSRVAYTLNWILFKNHNPNQCFFPILQGRNSNLVKYNMGTILSLYYKEEREIYYNKSIAYILYCKLINKIFEKCNHTIIKEPYYIEMLLFSFFEEAVKEVKNKVKIILS
jgi:hypothetical protein